MTAQIRPVGMLKTYIGGKDEVTVPAGQTVRQALYSLAFPPEVVALVLVANSAATGESAESKDYVLKEGDTVRLLAVIGGG